MFENRQSVQKWLCVALAAFMQKLFHFRTCVLSTRTIAAPSSETTTGLTRTPWSPQGQCQSGCPSAAVHRQWGSSGAICSARSVRHVGAPGSAFILNFSLFEGRALTPCKVCFFLSLSLSLSLCVCVCVRGLFLGRKGKKEIM